MLVISDAWRARGRENTARYTSVEFCTNMHKQCKMAEIAC